MKKYLVLNLKCIFNFKNDDDFIKETKRINNLIFKSNLFDPRRCSTKHECVLCSQSSKDNLKKNSKIYQGYYISHIIKKSCYIFIVKNYHTSDGYIKSKYTCHIYIYIY